MKRTLFFLLTAGIFAACSSAPKGDEAKTDEKQEAANATGTSFNVDAAASSVDWVGTKPTGQHNGSFKLNGGTLAVENGNITGGSFNIDVNSLSVADLKGEDSGKLAGHLKSPDFFDTEKYAGAKFEITKVEPYDSTKGSSSLAGATHTISGNLTLKDSTKNVTFPAVVKVDGETLNAEANFNIDRTQWGINYKGPNNPQDWVIRKEVNLKLHIKANK